MCRKDAVAKGGLRELDGEDGGKTSPLRKLCAHSKDRFKVYGRRIIPFIVLVNPGIYTRRSSRTLLRSPPSPPLSLTCTPPPTFRVLGNLDGALIPFHFTSAFYEPALQDRLRRYASFGNERVAFRRPYAPGVSEVRHRVTRLWALDRRERSSLKFLKLFALRSDCQSCRSFSRASSIVN